MFFFFFLGSPWSLLQHCRKYLLASSRSVGSRSLWLHLQVWQLQYWHSCTGAGHWRGSICWPSSHWGKVQEAMHTIIDVVLNLNSEVSLVHVIVMHIVTITLLASERDTYRGNTIENRGCLFVYICLDVRMSFFYFDPHVFLL